MTQKTNPSFLPIAVVTFVVFAIVCVLSCSHSKEDKLSTGTGSEKDTAHYIVASDNPELVLKLRKTKGKYFDIRPILDDEIVHGEQGSHYEVVIGERVGVSVNTQDTLKVIHFGSGRYILNEHDNKIFEKAIKEISDSVLTLLKDKIPYRLFLVGSADALGSKTFKRERKPFKDELRRIPFPSNGKISGFVKATTSQTYDYQGVSVDTLSLPNPFSNYHLPNYRAFFMHYVLATQGIPKETMHILDGSVTTRVSPSDRRVSFILCVKLKKQH